MGFLDIVRPEPKCRHNNIRGFCSQCNGLRSERIPTGTFRNGKKVTPKRRGK